MRVRSRFKSVSPLAQWLILAAVLSILGLAIAWNLYSDHNAIAAQQGERLSTQAAIVEKNIVPQLLLANRVIEDILDRLPAWVAENDGFKRADRALQAINNALIGTNPILLIDAKGTVIASSNKELHGMNFRERDYFQSALRNPGPGILHVSAPFRTVLDTFVVSFSRTISGPNGEFSGIVIVSAVPEYFSTLLDSVRYAPDMRASIVHDDGIVFLNSPALPGVDGMNLASPGTFFTRHMQSGTQASVFSGTAFATGDERLMAQRTIRLANPAMDHSLVVAVSRDMQSIFAEWRQDAYIRGGLFCLVALTSALGLYSYQQRKRAYEGLLAEQEAERSQGRKSLEKNMAELAQSESRLARAMEATNDGLWEWDVPSGQAYFSPAYYRMLGYEESWGSTAKAWIELMHPEDRARVLAVNQDCVAGRIESFAMEFRMRAKDGGWRWILGRGKAVRRDSAGKALLMIGTHVEITERKEAEAKLIAAVSAAEAATLAKSNFLAAASHDLRQPIQAISMFCEAFTYTELSEDQKKISNCLALSAKSLGDLLNALLDISKFDVGLVKPVYERIEIRPLIRNIGAQVGLSASAKQLRLRLFSGRRALALNTDANLLRSLLGNLLDNAVKYTERGGILLGIRRRGERVLIQVWDSGIGIAPKDVNRIFEEYFQVENRARDKSKGLGLGLAIARRIASLLGTEVACRSRPGKGSVFEFSLPLAEEPLNQVAKRVLQDGPDGDAAFSFDGLRIVVIDDDWAVAAAIKLALKSKGMSVTTYSNAEDALANPDIAGADFYISDLRLPGMNGREFLDALQRRALQPIRGAILTGDTSAERVELATSSNWTVIFKPVDLSGLLSTIRATGTHAVAG